MAMDNVDAVFALSPQQEGFLYHSVADGDAGVFVTQVVLDLTGEIAPDAFRAAWESAVVHHDMLRTIFLWDGLDEPVQVVRSAVDLPFDTLDWSEAKTDDTAEFLRRDRQKGFDLSQAPLMRVTLIRKSSTAWTVIWTFHHILLDGWSSQIVLRDVMRSYAGQALQDAQGISYSAFVETIPEPGNAEVAAFWSARLADLSSPTRFLDRNGKSTAGYATQDQTISAEKSEALRAFARAQRVTLNTLFNAAWARLLATHSGETDVTFGATLSGRSSSLAGLDRGVGLFMNTLPLTVRFSDQALGDWLRALQQEQTRIQEMEQSPLVDVQRQSSVPQGVGVFDTIVVFENLPGQDGPAFAQELAGTGLSVDDINYFDQSNYPLALIVLPGEQIQLRLVHDQSAYSAEFCTGLLAQFETVFDGFLSHPDCAPGEVAVSERVVVALPVEGVSDTPPLSHILAQHAEANPDASAVLMGARNLSYADLHAQAGRIANRLRARGVGAGDFVGLFAPRSPEFVAGVFGILRAGAAFVPLDPDYPRQHHEFVCHDVPMRALLVADDTADVVRDLGPEIIRISADTKDQHPDCDDHSEPDGIAYLIHTSGSQGQRKGVTISHRNLTYSTLARRTFYDTRPDRFLLLSPVSFDSAMVGLFWTMAEGGTLVLPEPGQERDVERLCDLIAARGVTHTLAIPSLYRLLSEAARPEQLASLCTVALAGEACSPGVVNQHFAKCPDVGLVNEYGPTEATVWSVAAHLSPDTVADGSVPIGTAIPGAAVYILDHWGHPVPDGVEGELFIGGPGVAQGYFGKPDLTAERFLPDPFSEVDGARMYRTGDVAWRRRDGQIIYTGRNDDQLKIRGFRVEPNEIAARLEDHPNVAEAAVLMRPRDAQPDDRQVLERLNALDPATANALLSEIAEMSDAEIAKEVMDLT